jgi:MoxR-like ATPase
MGLRRTEGEHMANEGISKGAAAAADVSALLRARNALIWIVTREEARAERLIGEACAAAGYVARTWDCGQGVADMAGRPLPDIGDRDPVATLTVIRDRALDARRPERGAWILRDLPAWLRDPGALRQVRNLARFLPTVPRDQAQAVIMITPSAEIPPELAGHATLIEWPLPDRSEIAALLDATLAALPDDIRAAAAPNGTRDAAIDAAIGLTGEEAASCYARSLVQTRRIDPATVSGEKRRVIARERVLEWYDPIPGGLESVGGLDALKGWLVARRAAFSPRARAFGLPAPKGAMLVGVPGCGKSLTAKAIATAWGMPLLRLDLGGLRSKYVGESEGKLRAALKVAESVSPCVIWIDEIEKALAGATQGAADGGVSADALGTLLSFMQERQGAVFVIATANDASNLPPELLRKGRFDEIWWVDLPTASERVAILSTALRAHGRTADGIDLRAVASACEAFTGSEIAAIVPDALFAAFADSERALTTADLQAAARTVVPLSSTAAEKIGKLRDWAKGRARPATTPDAAGLSAALPVGRSLDL